MRFSRLFGPFLVAVTAILFFSVPATPAPSAPKKKAPTKKKAPKPKHHVKKNLHAKSHQSSHHKPRKSKKAHPKVKHHAKSHVKSKSHKAPQRNVANGRVPNPKDRTQTKISNRSHEWSNVSNHEHLWHHNHWHTHRFARFDVANGGGFHFHPGWWNSYVVNPNPGTPNWNEDPPVPVKGSPAGPMPPVAGVAPPIVTLDQGMPLSQAGVALAKKLDFMKVESHWLPNQSVDWKTGDAEDPSIEGPASNGGAFVTAVCNESKLTMPHSEREDFLPATQIDWFLTIGKERGWVKVGEIEAQVLANQGWVVVAAWQNMGSAGHREITGQLAIVRPDQDPVSELAARGPRIIMAGPKQANGQGNYNSIGLKDGFPAGAWTKQEVVYLAHCPVK